LHFTHEWRRRIKKEGSIKLTQYGWVYICVYCAIYLPGMDYLKKKRLYMAVKVVKRGISNKISRCSVFYWIMIIKEHSKFGCLEMNGMKLVEWLAEESFPETTTFNGY